MRRWCGPQAKVVKCRPDRVREVTARKKNARTPFTARAQVRRVREPVGHEKPAECKMQRPSAGEPIAEAQPFRRPKALQGVPLERRTFWPHEGIRNEDL